ncbi:hypothetical protein B0O99DRAFT_519093 [Bisporella sp. PMI_857]|nr:hypothetical protein B0O99DRAFT_519093 [Bisporella sp. PMI_857]
MQVLYPAAESADFNMDYYLKTHMPLVQKLWVPEGLKGWKVISLDPASGFRVQAILTWESEEAWKKVAAAPQAAAFSEIMGDIKNFTKASPQVWSGVIAGGWSA